MSRCTPTTVTGIEVPCKQLITHADDTFSLESLYNRIYYPLGVKNMTTQGYPEDSRVLNIHTELAPPAAVERIALVKGDYGYWHYGCDGTDDRGWGCGYRTLQTISDWTKRQLKATGKDRGNVPVPNLREIQSKLVEMQDKETRFIGSRDWIGSVEVGLIIDFLYDVPCKILHVESGSKLNAHSEELFTHFTQKGSPIMMAVTKIMHQRES